MSPRNVRPKSISAEAARKGELARLTRLSILERMAKALEFGRRGRQMRVLMHGVKAKEEE
jgi:hypothetical protein